MTNRRDELGNKVRLATLGAWMWMRVSGALSVPVVQSLVQLTARPCKARARPPTPLHTRNSPPPISSFNNQILSERGIDCWAAKIITSI